MGHICAVLRFKGGVHAGGYKYTLRVVRGDIRDRGEDMTPFRVVGRSRFRLWRRSSKKICRFRRNFHYQAPPPRRIDRGRRKIARVYAWARACVYSLNPRVTRACTRGRARVCIH